MGDYSEIIREAVKTGVFEAVRILQPKSDEISQRKAYAEFGKAFVEQAACDGRISIIRKGTKNNSKKIYSRSELTRVMAERNILRSIIRLESVKA